MLRVIVPIDGSEVADRAARRAVEMSSWLREKPEIHLINVQPPLPKTADFGLSHEKRDAYHREVGEQELANARKCFGDAGFTCTHHVSVGDPAKVITHYVREEKADVIVMGTHGRGAVAGAIMGSVAREVLESSEVPVLLVR